MTLTKVSGGILDPGINVAGIVTATGFDGPFTGGSSKNITAGIITATGLDVNGNGDISGSLTVGSGGLDLNGSGDISGNLVVHGNLTANGDFTTLNTTLREVELLRVDANSSEPAGIITQTGSGDILNLYDNTTEVFSVEDGGKVKIGMGLLGTNTSDYDAAANNLIVGTGSGDEGITILSGQSVGHHGSIFFADGTGAINSKRGQIRYEQNSERMKFFTAGSQKLTIDINGNVGIGTDVPAQKLHVYGSGNQLIMLQSTTTANAQLQLKTSQRTYNLENVTGGTLQIRDGSVGSTRLSINSSGTVTVNNVLDVNTRVNVGGASVGFTPHNTSWATAASINLKGNYGGGISFNDNDNNGYSMYAEGNGANFSIKNGAVGGTLKQSIKCVKDEGVELYFNDNKVAFTTLDAWNVYGRTSNSGMIEIASNQGANNNDRFRIHKTSAASRLTIQNYASGNWVENIRITAGGAVELKHADGTTHFETTSTGFDGSGSGFNLQASDSGAVNLRLQNSSTGTGTQDGFLIQLDSNEDAYIWHRENQTIFFGTQDTTRWKIDNNGHLLPGTSGGYNIGSASAEIGDVYIADSKKIHLGSDQDFTLYHNNSHAIIKNTTGRLYVLSDDLWFKNQADNSNLARFLNGDTSIFYFAGNEKFRTHSKGISVTGEVAASQDYPNFRPVLDFNFAATKKLDPRMTFTREGSGVSYEASFHDGVGSVKFVGDNEPRFEHDILTGECKGLMFEQAGTNYSWYSRRFDMVNTGSWVKVTGNLNVVANSHTAPDGTSSGVFMADTISGANGNTFNGNVMRQQITAGAGVKHTFSIYVKLLTSTQATIYVRDGQTGSTASASAVNTKTWQRLVVTSNNALTNGIVHSFYIGNTNGDIAVWGSQIERSDYVTSYIKTDTGVNGTRNTDKGVHLDGEDVADIFNDGRGTLIAEAILTQSQPNNPIVGFYENFTDDNRVELRGDASSVGTARFEAVVNDSSVASLTTGLTHSGVNNVSKYAYAFELNNYAGCVNGGTVATDTGGAFPSGMNSMMIGEAVYNVDAAVIVKRIMYYADRLPNSQLVTLTS